MLTVISHARILRYQRSSCTISLAPEDLQRIGGDVTVAKRVPRDDSRHGYDVIQIRESWLDGERVPNCGLRELLVYRAHQQGYRLQEVADTPTACLPAPVCRNQLVWPSWIDFVHQHELGLVRISEDVDVPAMIAELVVAFPEQRIMVLGRVAKLRSYFASLLRLFPDEFQKSGQMAVVHAGRPLRIDDDQDWPRLILCTPCVAADLDSEKCDIIVILDAYECLHERMAWPLIQMDGRFRLFGLMPSRRVQKPYEEARLRVTFGFRQLDLHRHGRVRRDICSAWIRQGGQAPNGTVLERPGVGGRRVTQFIDPLQAYVHNHQRNDTITRLAKKLRAGQPVDSRRLQEIATWSIDRERQPKSIMIIVDRLDHAVQLHRQLRDWPIVAGESNLDGIPASARRLINCRMSQWLPCQIVVADAARNAKGFHADVVIWAGGGAMAGIPEGWMYTFTDSRRPLLIVDFIDDFAPAARRLSRQRANSLEALDIFRVGEPPVLGRIRRFERQIGGEQ